MQTLIFHIISTAFLAFYVFLVIPIRIQIYKSRMKGTKQEKKDMTIMQIINFAANSTIFEDLSVLNKDNTDFNSQELDGTQNKIQSSQTPQQIEKQLRKRARTLNTQQYYQEQQGGQEFSGAVICDCYDCCCEGCPWQVGTENSTFQKLKQYKSSINGFFFKNFKILAFFLIKMGGYTYIPFNGLSYFTKNIDAVVIFALIFFSLQFFLLSFTLSMISTRREIVRLERHNQIQRALIIYYHFRKSIVFTLIFGFLICISTALIIHIEGNSEWYMQNQFNPLIYFYYFIMNINILVLLKYTGCLSNDLISDDDRILKAQQRLYALKNNIIKYIPSDQDILSGIVPKISYYLHSQQEEKKEEEEKEEEKYEFHDNQFKLTLELRQSIINEFDRSSQRAKEKLKIHMKAVDQQKFKKIKKNLGAQRYQITFLIIYLYLQTVLIPILTFFLMLASYSKFQEGKFHFEFLTRNMETLNLAFNIILFLQYTLLPYLIGVMCNKRALLGQDYGQRLQITEESKVLNNIAVSVNL